MNKSIRKLTLFCISIMTVGIIVTIVIFVFTRSSEPTFLVSGDAESVMTTKVKVYDGIWDKERHSDEFYRPLGIGITSDNHLIVADSMCDRIQIIDGDRNTRIGMPEQYGLTYLDSGALVDGYRENAMFMKPSGVFVCDNGDILVSDSGNHVIRLIDKEFVMTIAGNGEGGYQNGKEFDAQFNEPRSAIMSADGLIYVADTLNHCIRVIDEDGNVSLYAGKPGQSGYMDGALLDAKFFEPSGLAFGPDGTIYVADSANHAIRKISDSAVETLAGIPGEVDRNSGYPKGGYTDGDLESAQFNFPRDIAVLPDGEIAVADSLNHAIRLIKKEGIITLAGGGDADMYYLSAENIKLSRPEGICIDQDGEYLYISDSFNNRVVALPMNERIMEGRPSREAMLNEAGITLDSKYSYKGDLRIFIGNTKVNMGRIAPWNTADGIYVPIRPLFEALDASVTLDEGTGTLYITIQEQDTILKLNHDYFYLRGVMVTTFEEIRRLFPYHMEWFSEYGLISFHIPSDLAQY